MRAKEFLTEYKRDKTIEVFGPKLLAALKKDTSAGLPYQLKRERTLLNSPDMSGISIDAQTFNRVGDLILHAIETADPTKNKQYTQWLAKCYSNEGIKLEDIYSKGADWLEYYDELKRKNILPLDLRNINRLTFQELYNIVMDAELGGALEAERMKVMPKGTSKEWLNNEHVRIIQPLDEDAAKYYGNGTQWCTAARNNNMFKQYVNQGPMFILLPKFAKYEGEKYQFHPASGQCMNEQDEPVNPRITLGQRFGDLIPLFKQLDPSMDNMVIFADDTVLKHLIDQIKDFAMEPINDRLTDWEVDDEYYFKFLQDEGYVDDEGEVDWDRAPSYLEYNDDARREYNTLSDALNPSPAELRDAAEAYQLETEEPALLSDIEEVVAFSVLFNKSRSERGYLDPVAEWISTNLYVGKNNEVHQVKRSKTK